MSENTIVVALDGSDLSERALPYAVALAKASQASIHLVTVWEEGERALVANLPDVSVSVFKKGEQHWERYLAAHAKSVKAEGVLVETEVVVGDPTTELLQLIEEIEPSVLVLASHGRSGIGRWRYGSVADKLARAASVPTLIVGPSVLEGTEKPTAIKRIMVPLDGSPTAESALRPALELADALDAEVLLARSLQWATQAMLYGVPDVNIAMIDEDLSKASESYLSQIKDSLNSDRVVEAVVLHGPPADALIALVEARDVDLIVMTSHTRDGLPRALLGSVADRLLQAPAPVLLIRPS